MGILGEVGPAVDEPGRNEPVGDPEAEADLRVEERDDGAGDRVRHEDEALVGNGEDRACRDGGGEPVLKQNRVIAALRALEAAAGHTAVGRELFEKGAELVLVVNLAVSFGVASISAR